jgi:hypothetical protein
MAQTWMTPVVVHSRQVDGALWWKWVLGSAAAGLLSGALALGVCGDAGFLLCGFVVAPILGLIQARILRPYLPRLTGSVWVMTTGLGGGLGWGLGFWLLGSVLIPIVPLPSVTNGQDGTIIPGNALLVLLAMLAFTAASGAILGLGFGLGQRASMDDLIPLGSGRTNPARAWVFSNVGAWVVALLVVLLAFAPVYAGIVRVPTDFARLGIWFLWTLAVTIAGAVTGSALQQLLRRATP